jgi:hypothetical protein
MAVVRANYVKRNENERATAKANIRYIQQRPGRDKEKLTRSLFGAAGFIGRYEAFQFIKDAPKGTYFYRLKLSPDPAGEDSKRDLNMQKLTRTMMHRLEKRLKTPIPWAAALHDDHTNIRHVHILAALPRALNKYELEYLIQEATRICEHQRRYLDRGKSRLPWQQQKTQQPLKSGKYTALSYFSAGNRRDGQTYRNSMFQPLPRGGRAPKIAYTSCTCPRCHFPQHHDSRGVHSCPTCGLMLHKKKELTLTRSRERGLERSL